jgi:hypothetical protein
MPCNFLYDIGKAKRDLNYKIGYSTLEMFRDWKKEMEARRFDHLIKREHKGL